MNSPIFRLPNELIFNVIQQLSIVDAFQLGLTCTQFHNIVYNRSICRALLEKQAPFSPECIEIRDPEQYVRAFRTLAQRRLAIANLEPFAATIVAAADSYLYVNGALLYIQGRTLRILHLRGIVEQEVVVDIRLLLDSAIEESKGTQLYKFTLLHYADDIITCRYTHCRTSNETWLVIFNIRENWASSTRVHQPNMLFARNNKDYVVYGTYTGHGDDGHRRWVLWRYSIRDKRVVGLSRYLDAIIGSEICENIYFSVLDDHFYAISNQSGIDFISGQHNSYYYCCRFPLENMEDMQVATKASTWRRLHDEGTIDDRWTLLRLEKSETTGKIMAVESRKEWRHGSGDSRRTYYTQELIFPSPKHKKISCRAPIRSESSYAGLGENNSDRDWTRIENELEDESEEEDENEEESEEEDYDDDENATLALKPCGSAARTQRQRRHPFRLPENVHPGDDSAKMMHFTYSSCFVRCYFLSSTTFMDLVDMPLDTDPFTRRLRLRSGSRREHAPQPCRAAPGQYENKKDSDDDPLYPLQDIEQGYYTTEVTMWPKDALGERDTGIIGENHSRHEALDKILNPPGHTGKVSGVWDDRSLVYGVERATDARGKGMHVIVFITFDPDTRLSNLQPWNRKSVTDTTGMTTNRGGERSVEICCEICSTGWAAKSIDEQELLPEDIQCDWLSITKPMYQSINRGFKFSS